MTEADRMIAASAERSGVDLVTFDPWQKREQIRDMLSDIRCAVRGGEEAVHRFLISGPGEEPDEYADRLRHGANVAVSRLGCDVLSWLATSSPPTFRFGLRSRGETAWQPEFSEQVRAARAGGPIEGDGQRLLDLAETYQDIFEENEYLDAVTPETAWLRNRDGVAWVKTFVEEELIETSDSILVSPTGVYQAAMPCEDCIPVPDPTNPKRVVALWEWRAEFGGWEFWTETTVRKVTRAGGERSAIEWGPERPTNWGRIPFRHLGKLRVYHGQHASMLVDAVMRQKELINRVSINWAGARSELFATLFLAGSLKAKNPEERLRAVQRAVELYGDSPRVGRQRVINMQEGSNAAYLKGGYPVAETDASVDAVLVHTLTIDLRIPPGLVHAGSAAEQPTTTRLRWLLTDIQNESLQTELRAFHRENAMIGGVPVKTWPSTRQYSAPRILDAEEIRVRVMPGKSPLPFDESAERNLDRADVISDLMDPADYVRKYTATNRTPQEIAVMLQEFGTDGARDEEPDRPNPFAGLLG